MLHLLQLNTLLIHQSIDTTGDLGFGSSGENGMNTVTPPYLTDPHRFIHAAALNHDGHG